MSVWFIIGWGTWILLYMFFILIFFSRNNGKSENGESKNGKSKNEKFLYPVLFILIFWVLFYFSNAEADSSRKYIKFLEQAENPSREAALTEQESNWNPLAKSPYATGLRQFTKRTGQWAGRTICRDIGPYKAYNERWQMLCGIRYVEHLIKNNHFGSYCMNRLIAEQEYNGGAWVLWEIEKAGVVDLRKAREQCGTKLKNGRKRHIANCKENYEYPIRISKKQPKFKFLGGEMCLIGQ